MPTLRNISPVGALRIPAYRLSVGRGETFDVTDEQAKDLLTQASNFELVQPKTETKKKVSQ